MVSRHRSLTLKILIVSWYFPPVNTIGALRVGKFARFLIERGHDVGVVAGKHWGHPETLPLGVPLERVAYAESVDINAGPGAIAGLRARLLHPRGTAQLTRPDTGDADHAQAKSVARRASELYRHLTNIPDNRIGWLPWTYMAGRRMCQTWQPDVVFGSGPPFTGLLAARALSSRLRVPWVAELRDRWADDPYSDAPRWRAVLDEALERRTVATAKALVTVTEPWAEFYRHKYGKPVATIYNGYDPLDFDFLGSTDRPAPRRHLVIGYTGGIYPGRRDPSPLFEALRMLGETAEEFRIVFCGTDPAHVLPLAERAGVKRLVEVRPAVPYKQSLEFQRQSDVLLLMQWNDPREQGNCPGKFFEYLASLRPILILGLDDGVPASIARERAAGVCINDPAAIASQLELWLREKDELGRVRSLPASAREGLSRNLQFEKLETFLSKVILETSNRGTV
jgi:glycosyltransferase involved in cell wall biosynthesis